MSAVRGWASAVCDQHLGEGADPTQSLVKIASTEGLTPPQVEVLACEINKAIHTKKFASAEDKYHAADFPYADAKKAIADLQAPAVHEKVAAVMPDPVCKDEFDFFQAFGVKESDFEKQASIPSGVAFRNKFQKFASLKRMQDDACALAKYASDESEMEYIRTVRQHMLQGNSSSERLLKLGEAIHAARCADMLDEARKPLAKLAHAFGQEGLVHQAAAKETVSYLMTKTADQAPDYLISDWIKAKVVNGSHPLIIKLKTYCDNGSELAKQMARVNLCDDQVRIHCQQMRAL